MRRWLIAAAVCLCVAPAAAQDKDADGSKDHPMFSRMPGYYIEEYDAQDFSSFELDTDPSRKVEVSLQARPRSIRARVRDQGTGFDLGATPDPTVGDNLMRSSGRGLLVMRAFVDKVDFKFLEGRGMEVTLYKKLGARKTTRSARPPAAAMDNGGIER